MQTADFQITQCRCQCEQNPYTNPSQNTNFNHNRTLHTARSTNGQDYCIGTARKMSVHIDATQDLLLLIQQKLHIMQYRYSSLSHECAVYRRPTTLANINKFDQQVIYPNVRSWFLREILERDSTVGDEHVGWNHCTVKHRKSNSVAAMNVAAELFDPRRTERFQSRLRFGDRNVVHVDDHIRIDRLESFAQTETHLMASCTVGWS